MKRYHLLLLFFFIFFSFSLSGLSIEDYYARSNDFFDFISDPNAGLTIFPILTIPMGGENEGMGTAYTAVARDSSFFDANPSASSTLKYTELTVLHNNWIADTSIEGIVYATRIDDIGIGIGGKFLYVPFTARDAWGQSYGKGYYSETIGSFNFSYNFLSGFYFQGISVGGNLKFAYRHVPATIYSAQSALGGDDRFGGAYTVQFFEILLLEIKKLFGRCDYKQSWAQCSWRAPSDKL